jgi:hypothetical protein
MRALNKSRRRVGVLAGGRAGFAAGRALVGGLAVILVLSGSLTGCRTGAADVGEANEVTRLEAENARLKKDLEAANTKVGELEQRVADLEESAAEPATGGVPPTNDRVSSGPDERGRQVGYIKRVYKKGSRHYLTIDYVQFLTGQAAIKAAIEDGFIKSGETLDNDYYIRNQNTKLRTFIIKVGIPVSAETYFSGGTPVGKATLTLAEFQSAMSPSDANNGSMRAAPWWITIQNLTVTKIQEQYVP